MSTFRCVWLGIIVATALGLGACAGDDGAAGPAGPAGVAGPTGPAGPPAPSSGVPAGSSEKINVAITGVSVPSGGGAPTVNVTLTNDLGQGLRDLPASDIRFVISQLTPGTNGGSSEWQSYVTRSSAGIANAQATTETATAGTFVDNNDGTYVYTFAQALTAYPGGPTYSETKTHRIGIEIRTDNADGEGIPANNAPLDFLPSGGAPIFERLIVDNDTCNACHDNLEFHGEARFDIEYCVQCHNPYSIDGDTVDQPWGGSVDMKVLIHKIHYGENLAEGYSIIGFRGTLHDYSDVVFPQDVRNCQTCHQESDTNTPQASNWRTVANRAACGTCHDDIDWANGGHPVDLTFLNDTQCLDCHGPDATVNNGDVQIAKAHEIPTRLAGNAFQFNIVSISNTGTGEFPVVEFSVTDPTNGDTPYDIHNDAPFTTCAFGASRLAIGIAWDTRDYGNVDSGNTPGLPLSLNPLTACGGSSTAVGDGVFSVTSPTAIPLTAVGTAAITIDGHPAVTIDGSVERIAVTNVVDYAPITDTAAVARREVTAIEKCDDCHNQLSIHGNNRTDNIQVCVTCHNPNATDINRRAGQCETELGLDDQSIDFKYMIHAIHAAGATGVPFEVCGFGNRPHVYDFQYPGRLNNCEGCHVPGGYYPVDPAEVLGTTVDANNPDIQIDDKVVSPNTAVCSTCHVSTLAAEHMRQNGGDFNATKAADNTLSSTGTETCQLCHGPGRTNDVKEAHGVGTFLFN
ncbi:MAG: OmcA/MtrC family decaheme c-type cytochrome [Gammaproteobacteria bacterium]|nr:OmcA/MtrC family decaheme c-type cytochrome [Gammaproteobacteria bacterium]